MLRISSFFLAAALLASPAVAQSSALRDLTVTPAAPVAQTQGFALEAWLDRANAIYTEGEAVQASVRAGADGYLSAFSIGPTGDVVQIFPNAFHPDNTVRAGEVVSIPGAGARTIVSGPFGLERIRIVLTSRPGSVCSPGRLAPVGAFQSVIGGEVALQRDLSVVAAGDAGPVLATADIAFQTAPGRVVGAASPIVIIAGGGHREVYPSNVVIAPQGGYPLPRF